MRRACRGQGFVELIVAVPMLILIAALAWQVVAVAWSAVHAEESARRAGLEATGESGRVVTVVGHAVVPGPIAGGASLRVRAAVLP